MEVAEKLDGSSPLTRGKLEVHAHAQVVDRLIPAHAGKTGSGAKTPCPRPAHPRSRGENAKARLDDRHADGSSPLTRGKLERSPCVRGMGRLIPAHAGKTRKDQELMSTKTAHPRSRGENQEGPRTDEHQDGSSPLTRGKRQWALDYKQVDRLIPAHAGKTLIRLGAGSEYAAHPRSRGENFRTPASTP